MRGRLFEKVVYLAKTICALRQDIWSRVSSGSDSDSGSGSDSDSGSISNRIPDDSVSYIDSSPTGSGQLLSSNISAGLLVATQMTKQGSLERIIGRLRSTDPAVRLPATIVCHECVTIWSHAYCRSIPTALFGRPQLFPVLLAVGRPNVMIDIILPAHSAVNRVHL